MARKMESPTAKARLFLVDDEPAVRKGLELLLGGRPDLEVCGEAESGAEALALIPRVKPDLVVVDLTLKGSDGLELMRRLRQSRPELKLLVFSMHNQLSYVRTAFEAGAQGYVAKDEGTEKLLEAIEALLAGKCYVTPNMAVRLPELRARLGAGGA